VEQDVLTALAVSKEFEKTGVVDEIPMLDSTILVVMEDGPWEMMEMNALHAV